VGGFDGLPPAALPPSAPLRGKLVKSFGRVDRPSATTWSAAFLYADGRLIWARSADGSTTTWIEQRLTQKGVDLLRSASTLKPGTLPASAWEDRKLRPYVPSRFMIVATYEYLLVAGGGRGRPPVKHELPARVQDFIPRGDRIVGSGLKVTTSEARTLDRILSGSGWDQTANDNPFPCVIEYTSGRVYGIDVNGHLLVIQFHPVLPDGRVPSFK
jgi:hypothetical protein